MNDNQNIKNIINKFKEKFNEYYIFLETASENDVAFFENKFGIKIPEEFRWFVLNVANGIEAKESWNSNLIDKVDFLNFFYLEDEFNPSIPFKLNTKVKFMDIDTYTEMTSSYGQEEKYPYEIILDDYSEEMSKYRNGEIMITSYGGGTSAILIVNGNEYGNIWIDCPSSNQEIYPDYTSNKKRLKFNDWLIIRIQRITKNYNYEIEYEKRLQEKEIQKHQSNQNESLLENENSSNEFLSSRKDNRNLLTRILDKIFN